MEKMFSYQIGLMNKNQKNKSFTNALICQVTNKENSEEF